MALELRLVEFILDCVELDMSIVFALIVLLQTAAVSDLLVQIGHNYG